MYVHIYIHTYKCIAFYGIFNMEHFLVLNVVCYQLHEGLVLSNGKQHTGEIAYIRPKYR